MTNPAPAYQGNDPYVFVSYSHADEDGVHAEIRWLQEQGINVWYDTAGIDVGAEWNDEIARAIKGATWFLFFVTPQSVASEHCRRELNFAQAEDRRIIVVHLQTTEVPDGLRLSLENRQAVHMQRMPRASYERSLLQALSSDEPQTTTSNSTTDNVVGPASAKPWIWPTAIFFLALLAAGVWLWVSTVETTSPPNTSIAVLPFIDLSPDRDQQHIGDGIAEEILDKLTGLDGLSVAARTSSFAFRAREKDLREISESLNVNTILEGSIRRDGDRIRITAQLINAADGFHLWSRSYERQLTDLFSIQTDIAEAVAGNLGVTLGVGNVNAFRGAGTNSIEAYESYLQARSQQVSRAESVRLLKRAVRLDPNYAAALAELGRTIASTMWDSVPQRAPSIIDEAVPHLLRAVKLEPDSAYAYTLLATVNYARANWIKSEEFFQKALAISPDSEALTNYANMLMRTGRSLDAISTYQAALRTGNGSGGLGALSIQAYVALGRIDSIRSTVESMQAPARQYYQFLIALNESSPSTVQNTLAELSNATGVRFFASAGHNFSDPVKVLAAIEAADEDPILWPSKQHDLALLAAYFGDPELSLRLIAVEARLTKIRLGALWYPVMRDIRRLDAFEELLTDINLPAYWREFGWSDHCRSTGEQVFECF